MAANTVWGLDIGNSAIKAVKMTKVGNACKIVEFDIVDIPFAEDDKDRPARLQQALGDLTTNHKFGSDPVMIAIAGNVCLHREFQLPPGSEDKLDDLVQYEAKQQIPFPLEQVEWGYERYDDPAGIGVALIAVRRNDIQDLVALTEKFKLNVRGVTAAPMALFNFINYEFSPQNTTLILDAGARGTDFVVMNKRQIYFRTIQIAGREITRVLENKFKVQYTKAEELKKNIAQSPQMEKILTVIEPTLRQLGAEIQRTIGFYKSKARGQRIYQCYLLGHTFRLPKMAEYLQTQVREAPFAIVEGLQRVKLDAGCNAEVWGNEFPTMAVAMGLGLQGLGLGELTLNLISAEKKRELEGVKWKAWTIAAAAVIVATLGFSYFQAKALLDTCTVKRDDLNRVVENVMKFEKEEEKLTKSLPPRKQMLERISRVAHDRGKIAAILSTLANLKGADGQPFFGAGNKTYLTNLYISRMPFPLTASSEILTDTNRTTMLNKAESLAGPKSIYAYLASASDPNNMAPEIRPDVPLAVILSGETEVTNARDKISELEKALKKLDEVKEKDKDLPIETGNTPVAYTESPLVYDWTTGKTIDKSLAAPRMDTLPSGEKKAGEVKYTAFHVILRWQDASDPDLPVVAAPVPVPVKK